MCCWARSLWRDTFFRSATVSSSCAVCFPVTPAPYLFMSTIGTLEGLCSCSCEGIGGRVVRSTTHTLQDMGTRCACVRVRVCVCVCVCVVCVCVLAVVVVVAPRMIDSAASGGRCCHVKPSAYQQLGLIRTSCSPKLIAKIRSKKNQRREKEVNCQSGRALRKHTSNRVVTAALGDGDEKRRYALTGAVRQAAFVGVAHERAWKKPDLVAVSGWCWIKRRRPTSAAWPLLRAVLGCN
jgi:hypothetical protein